MSCTNNSVISANFISSDTASNGRRLSFQQRTDTKWDSNIAAGDVIRYDVDEEKFVRSIADPTYPDGVLDLSNAEVVGVVETIAQTSGITYATVVIHGLMNYPGLTGDTSNGGAGGADIYFLSTVTPGGITFSVEQERGFIAKPVLQYCPIAGSSYNSIVINYLGYETSEAEQAAFRSSSGGVGEIMIVDVNASVPDGWVDTSVSNLLPVSSYQTAYSTYGTKYGSLEELTVNGTTTFVSSLLNKSIRPIDSTTLKGLGSYSKIVSVDTLNNKITVEHNTTQELLYKGSYANYELLEPSLGFTKLAITSGSITHFKTPKIETNIQANVNVSNQLLNFNTKTLLRIKPDYVVSYLPQEIQFKDVSITGTLGTENIPDLDAKIVSLESRIQILEQRLGI